MQRLIVTIRDKSLLEKVNLLPKNVRGKAVEKALALFFETPEGKGITGLFKAPKGAASPKGRAGAGPLGDFGD